MIEKQITDEHIEAIERAATAAFSAGDYSHQDALKRQAQFLRRRKREQDAGMDSSAAAWMGPHA